MNPETESESEPGTETETEVETQAETESESETVSEQETESEAETETETESETKTESEIDTEKQHANFVAFQEKLVLFEASGIQDDNWLEAQTLLEEIRKSYEEDGGAGRRKCLAQSDKQRLVSAVQRLCGSRC